MKKNVLYLLLIVIAGIISSCTKKNTSPTITANNNTSGHDAGDYPLFYTFEGFKDITVNTGEDTVVDMPVHVKFSPGSIGLSLTFPDLPIGVSVLPKSLVLYDTFDTIFVFKLKIDSAAVYDVTVHGQSTKPGRYPSNGGTSFKITAK